MFGAQTCPRCMQTVSSERLQSQPAICDSCGFVLTDSEAQTRKSNERSALKMVLAGAVILVLAFLQVVNWGSHAIEVIPLKISQALGSSSPASLGRMAQICLDLKKYDCVEQMYSQITMSDPQAFETLGKFQNSRAEFALAANSYQQYFAHGGQDLDAEYNYAKALGQIDKVDEAAQYYDKVLAAKPGILQVTVAQNYVKLLVDHGRFEEALKVITSLRKHGTSAENFMDTEYNDIKQRMEKHS